MTDWIPDDGYRITFDWSISISIDSCYFIELDYDFAQLNDRTYLAFFPANQSWNEFFHKLDHRSVILFHKESQGDLSFHH
jgi:hypothetical protein